MCVCWVIYEDVVFVKMFKTFTFGNINPVRHNPSGSYLDVLVLRQAGRDNGEGVVVQVQLTQVGDVGHCAVFNRADLVVAQAQSAKEHRIIRHNPMYVKGQLSLSTFITEAV